MSHEYLISYIVINVVLALSCTMSGKASLDRSAFQSLVCTTSFFFSFAVSNHVTITECATLNTNLTFGIIVFKCRYYI